MCGILYIYIYIYNALTILILCYSTFPANGFELFPSFCKSAHPFIFLSQYISLSYFSIWQGSLLVKTRYMRIQVRPASARLRLPIRFDLYVNIVHIVRLGILYFCLFQWNRSLARKSARSCFRRRWPDFTDFIWQSCFVFVLKV